jgi:hypothetical protein
MVPLSPEYRLGQMTAGATPMASAMMTSMAGHRSFNAFPAAVSW